MLNAGETSEPLLLGLGSGHFTVTLSLLAAPTAIHNGETRLNPTVDTIRLPAG